MPALIGTKVPEGPDTTIRSRLWFRIGLGLLTGARRLELAARQAFERSTR